MNILNQEIEHVTFGKGKVISQEADKLSVQFPGCGTKQFVYPDAFEKYLKLSDAAIATSVQEELHAKRARSEAERAQKYQEYDEASQMKALEKAALAGEKRKAAPKSGAAKKKKAVKSE